MGWDRANQRQNQLVHEHRGFSCLRWGLFLRILQGLYVQCVLITLRLTHCQAFGLQTSAIWPELISRGLDGLHSVCSVGGTGLLREGKVMLRRGGSVWSAPSRYRDFFACSSVALARLYHFSFVCFLVCLCFRHHVCVEISSIPSSPKSFCD